MISPLLNAFPISLGLIFDKFGSYDAAFILSGSTLIIGIILMFVVQRMIGKRLAAEKAEKACEVIMPSSDDIKIIVDFDERIGASRTHIDKQHLVPWRRRVLEEPYSRPSSLVISRLLDDAQFTDGASHCPSLLELPVSDDQSAFVGYPIVTASVPEQITIISKRYSQCYDTDKDTQSIISGDRESLILTQRDASGSINSDSGRSTGSEETASLKSGRSRASSADTGFQYDTETEKDASSENVTRYRSQDTIHKSSCSLYSEKGSESIDDIFSKLMEKALEIEKIYPDIKPNCIRDDTELSRITQDESPCTWKHVLDTRETVL